jgi:hypothetical protein
VAVLNVVGGYKTADWNTGWSISQSNDCPNLALNTTIYPPYSPHNPQVNITGNAATATKWATARTLALIGDATGSVSMDGSANKTLSVVVNNDSHDHTKLGERNNISYGWTGLQYMDGSGWGGTGLTGSTPKNPINDWNYNLVMNHSNGGGYYGQISMPFHSTSMYISRMENGTLHSAQRVYADNYHPNADQVGGYSHSAFGKLQSAQTWSGTNTFNGFVNLYAGARLNDNDILYFGSGNDVEFFCNGSHLYTDLNSGIGNWYIRDGSTIRFTFDDSGHFTATGNITAYSDERLKDNYSVIGNALDKLCSLTGYTYDRIDLNNDRQAGFKAGDVEKILPEVVQVDEDSEEKYKSVAYGNMGALYVEAIKELKSESDATKHELREEVAKLKDMMKELMGRLD